MDRGRAGWVRQALPGHLIWCPQHVNCAKGKEKKNPTHLVYNSSALFHWCMIYCSLVGVEKPVVKIRCIIQKLILAHFWFHPKFKKIIGNGFTCHRFFTLGTWERTCVILMENMGERRRNQQDLLSCTYLYIILLHIPLFFLQSRLLVNRVHSEFIQNMYMLLARLHAKIRHVIEQKYWGFPLFYLYCKTWTINRLKGQLLTRNDNDFIHVSPLIKISLYIFLCFLQQIAI